MGGAHVVPVQGHTAGRTQRGIRSQCCGPQAVLAREGGGSLKSSWDWGRVQGQGLAVQPFRGSLTLSEPQFPHW